MKNSSNKETNIDTNDTQKTPKILCKSEKNKIKKIKFVMKKIVPLLIILIIVIIN